jgi:predicted permease
MWRRYLRFWKTDVEADIDDEVRFHLAMRVDQYLSDGMTRQEALAAARAHFGDLKEVREMLKAIDGKAVRKQARAHWWDAVIQDLRIATRGLRREPGFALAIIITLGLGIGANAAMFGIIDRLLFRAPPLIGEPDRVAHVYFSRTVQSHSYTSDVGNYPLFAELERALSGVVEMAAYASADAPVGEGAEAWNAEGTLVTSGFFPLLGVRPALGRFFLTAEDDPKMADPGIVISSEIWQSRFGSDSGILGRRLLIRGHQYPIVGVAPRGFTGVELSRSDLWLPIGATGDGFFVADWKENAGSYWLRSIARLEKGVPASQAAARATTVFQRYLLADIFPDSSRTARVALGGITGAHTGDNALTPDAKVAAWLAGIAGIVLVVACANVANLLLLRGMRRRREIAVRRALGMSRLRLTGQLLAEGLLLAVVGGGAALAATYWIGQPLRTLLMPGIVWSGTALDLRMLLVTSGVVLGTALFTGLIPSLGLGRTDLTVELKSGGPGHSRRRSRTQVVLLLTQTALSMMLLVGAGLFMKSLSKVRSVRLGFDAPSVLVVSVEFPTTEKIADIAAFYERARERVRHLPGVESASIAQSDPFGWSFGAAVRVPGRDSLPETSTGGPYYSGVSADHFATMGTRVIRGRGFTPADRKGSAPVGIIDETMARLYWPGMDPVGRCFYAGDGTTCIEVVGVVESSKRTSLREDPTLQFYLPLEQVPFTVSRLALFVRTGNEAEEMTPVIRRSLQELSPFLPYPRIWSLQSLVDNETRPWRLGATTLSALGGLALVLAAVGLYSVIAYSVTQRRQEMGIRLALGARIGQIIRLVLREGLRLALIGVVLGLGLAAVLGRFIRDLLYETKPSDPWVWAGAAGALGLAAIVACLLPAWRAGRADPVASLKAE